MRAFAASVAYVVLALAGPTAAADTVMLRNGDRISGEIVGKAGDTLTIKTEYADELQIDWSHVVSVRTEKPIEVQLRDGRIVEATEVGTGGAALSLDQVAFLKPDDAQAGRGFVYDGHVTLAAKYTRGNSQTDSFYGEAALNGHAKNARFFLFGNVNQNSEDGVDTDENWLLKGDYDWFFDRPQFLYARTSFKHDQFADIDLRSTFGGGYGRDIFDEEDLHLSLKGGLDYVVVDPITGPRDEYTALGWGVRYKQWFWRRKFQVFHEADGYWSLEDSDDVLVRTRQGLRIPLRDSLNLTAQLNLDWNGDPEPGTKEYDSTWLLGLGYTW